VDLRAVCLVRAIVVDEVGVSKSGVAVERTGFFKSKNEPASEFKGNREIPHAARGFIPHGPEVSGAIQVKTRAIFE